MISPLTSNIIIFNGELYNYIEIKNNLKQKEVIFETEGDTEVILKAIEKNGISAIKEFNGAWSFVFYNRKHNKIIISRDRYGKKPFYYYKDNENLIISSEIKSIFSLLSKKRNVRKEYIKAFIDHNYWPNDTEDTLYYNIKQLLPGEIGEVSLSDKDLKIKKNYFNTLENFSKNTNQSDLATLIKDSIKIRLRSDVKTAVLVSGGTDSSFISSIANKLNKNLLFIKGFMGNDDDQLYAKEFANNININLKEISLIPNPEENILNRIKKIIEIAEQPIPITGFAIASCILFEEISKLGIKVIIDGMGGDEVYGGYYDRYSKPFINSCIEKKKYLDLIKFIYYSKKHGTLTLKASMKGVVQKFCNFYFNINFNSKIYEFFKLSNKNVNPFIKKKLYDNLEDYQMWDNQFGHTQMTLKLYENSAMMNSVEVRSPFYDYRQIYNIKSDINSKFSKGFNKYMLREILPKEISEKVKWRKSKQAFKWSFEKELMENYLDLIKIEITKSKLVNIVLSKKNIDKLYHNINVLSNKQKILRLFSVAMLEKIYECEIS